MAGKTLNNSYGALELQTPEKRQAAREALIALWDAMDLSNPPGGIVLPGQSRAAYDAHYQAYWFIGLMLLDGDCPQREVRT